jgi:RES domain-containing protein
MVDGGPVYDPQLLDRVESHAMGRWEGTVWRQVFGGTPVLRPNAYGGRWNPRGVDALYTSLSESGAVAEIDYLISRQSIPITRPRITWPIDVVVMRAVDLTTEAKLADVGLEIDALRDDDAAGDVEAENLAACQEVGGAVAWLGYSGLLVPSLRSSATNVIIYPANHNEPDDYAEPRDRKDYPSSPE